MALDAEVKRQLEAQAQASQKALQDALDSGQIRHPVSIQVRQDMIKQIDTKLADLLKLADSHNLSATQAGIFKSALEVDVAGPGFNPVGQQAVDEFLANSAETAKQKAELDDFRTKAETQMFGSSGGTLQDALSNPQGELGQLSEILRNQQSQVFNQELKPLIDQGLASQGLFDSGARVEGQAKALGGLERARQDSLLQAALGGRDSIRGLEQSSIYGQQANRQAALQNSFDLQRTGISMAFQRQLEQERAGLAQQLSQRKGASGLNWGSTLGAVGGGLLGMPFGPAGMMIGSTLGGALGGQAGGGDPNQSGAQGAAFGSLFAGRQFQNPFAQQMGSYGSPYINRGGMLDLPGASYQLGG